ncbi:MAG TPA: organic hydroperoxide resistance protein, partial [Sphingomonas sp.]
GPRSEGGYGITADLLVTMPGTDRAEGEKLIAAAHEVCPYSNATRGNVDVGLTLA